MSVLFICKKFKNILDGDCLSYQYIAEFKYILSLMRIKIKDIAFLITKYSFEMDMYYYKKLYCNHMLQLVKNTTGEYCLREKRRLADVMMFWKKYNKIFENFHCYARKKSYYKSKNITMYSMCSLFSLYEYEYWFEKYKKLVPHKYKHILIKSETLLNRGEQIGSGHVYPIYFHNACQCLDYVTKHIDFLKACPEYVQILSFLVEKFWINAYYTSHARYVKYKSVLDLLDCI